MNKLAIIIATSLNVTPHLAGAESKQVFYTKDDDGTCHQVIAIEREGVHEIEKQPLNCQEPLSKSQSEVVSDAAQEALDQTTYDDLF